MKYQNKAIGMDSTSISKVFSTVAICQDLSLLQGFSGHWILRNVEQQRLFVKIVGYLQPPPIINR